MKKFVFLTGILNVILGILFALPGVMQTAGIQPPENPFWLMFPAIFLFFLGIILMYSSRDLENRATIVFWDGLSRVAAFLGVSWFGLFAGMGFFIVIAASADLVIARTSPRSGPQFYEYSSGPALFNR
jgi:hypothetical protein